MTAFCWYLRHIYNLGNVWNLGNLQHPFAFRLRSVFFQWPWLVYLTRVDGEMSVLSDVYGISSSISGIACLESSAGVVHLLCSLVFALELLGGAWWHGLGLLSRRMNHFRDGGSDFSARRPKYLGQGPSACPSAAIRSRGRCSVSPCRVRIAEIQFPVGNSRFVWRREEVKLVAWKPWTLWKGRRPLALMKLLWHSSRLNLLIPFGTVDHHVQIAISHWLVMTSAKPRPMVIRMTS